MVVSKNHLPFDVLSDVGAKVIREYGLIYHDPIGRGDIALPANFLLDQNGRVAWRWLAKGVQDRADPADVLDAINKLLGKH